MASRTLNVEIRNLDGKWQVVPKPKPHTYILEWSSEFSDQHSLIGIYDTLEQAKANVPDGRWRIYEAEVGGTTPRLVALTPGWDDE